MKVKLLKLNHISDIFKTDIPLQAMLSISQQIVHKERFDFFMMLATIEMIEMLKTEQTALGYIWTAQNEDLYATLVALDTSYTARENYEEKESIAKKCIEILQRQDNDGTFDEPTITDKISVITIHALLSNVKISVLRSPVFTPLCNTLKVEYNLPVEDIFATCMDMAMAIDTSLSDALFSKEIYNDGKQESDSEVSNVLH